MVHISNSRYEALSTDKTSLDQTELEDGWHFCYEWDGLLIHPSFPEASCCACISQRKLDNYKAEREANWKRDRASDPH